MIPLNASQIQAHISPQNRNVPMDITIVDTLDSTSQYLKTHNQSGISICCAEAQTKGRGRFNRHWFSPPFENIYFSMRLTLSHKPTDLFGLSIIISIAVIEMLCKLNIKKNIALKWPNDVLWEGKKLCGCLIEIMQTEPLDVIIGIGINVNSKTQAHSENNLFWCSLFDITQQQYDRNRITGILINSLLKNLSEFSKNGFVRFIKKWEQYDYLKGKRITVTHSSISTTGIAHGIDMKGQLVLCEPNGVIHYFSSGETTLSKD